MLRTLRISSMFGALLIVLAHLFVPHQHQDELSAEGHIELHQRNDSFLDCLALAFHEQPLAEELVELELDFSSISCYSQNTDQDCFSFHEVFVQNSHDLDEELKASFFRTVCTKSSSTFPSSTNRRGPPSIAV
jgi:hypothetical protein